jgi:hypothetical protein
LKLEVDVAVQHAKNTGSDLLAASIRKIHISRQGAAIKQNAP